MVLGGLAPDLGVGAGAESAGELAPDVELDVGVAHQQRLRVGVDGDELDALETDLDHPVDGVDAAAADADDLDDGEVVLRCCHVGASSLSAAWSVPGCPVSRTLTLKLRVIVMSTSEVEVDGRCGPRPVQRPRPRHAATGCQRRVVGASRGAHVEHADVRSRALGVVDQDGEHRRLARARARGSPRSRSGAGSSASSTSSGDPARTVRTCRAHVGRQGGQHVQRRPQRRRARVHRRADQRQPGRPAGDRAEHRPGAVHQREPLAARLPRRPAPVRATTMLTVCGQCRATVTDCTAGQPADPGRHRARVEAGQRRRPAGSRPPCGPRSASTRAVPWTSTVADAEHRRAPAPARRRPATSSTRTVTVRVTAQPGTPAGRAPRADQPVGDLRRRRHEARLGRAGRAPRGRSSSRRRRRR